MVIKYNYYDCQILRDYVKAAKCISCTCMLLITQDSLFQCPYLRVKANDEFVNEIRISESFCLPTRHYSTVTRSSTHLCQLQVGRTLVLPSLNTKSRFDQIRPDVT